MIASAFNSGGLINTITAAIAVARGEHAKERPAKDTQNVYEGNALLVQSCRRGRSCSRVSACWLAGTQSLLLQHIDRCSSEGEVRDDLRPVR